MKAIQQYHLYKKFKAALRIKYLCNNAQRLLKAFVKKTRKNLNTVIFLKRIKLALKQKPIYVTMLNSSKQ